MNYPKNIKWHLFHKRNRSPFFHQIFLTGPGIRNKNCPFDNRIKHFGCFLDHVVVDKKQMSVLKNRTLKYLKNRPHFLLQMMVGVYKKHQNAIKKWKKLQNKDFSSSTNKELAKTFKQYSNQLLSFGIYVTLPLFVEDYFEEILSSRFIKMFGQKRGLEYFNIAVDPVKSGTVLEEEIALLKLAKKSKVKPQEIKDHAFRFGYMANVGFFEKYYSEKFYLKRIKNLKKQNPAKKLKEILDTKVAHKRKFKALISKIKKNSKNNFLTTLLKTANEAVYFRSYRTEMFYGSPRYLGNLFKEIAKRTNIRPYQNLFWFYWEEIYNALIGEYSLSQKLLNSRKKGYSFLSNFGGKLWLWDGPEAWKVFEIFHQSYFTEIPKIKEIKGMPTFGGYRKGKAVVVRNLKELNKIKKDVILVTHATNVNFVPYLKKVSAIVTEEGGILSHAAIISRELKIPCVIGTKIATKIIKDGSLVEVDANKGIVRKL